MTDITIPAPVISTGGTESAASQVTTQETVDTVAVSPQAATPDGDPQAQEPAGEEQKKTHEEKRKERNRERWREFKQVKEALPQKVSWLEAEVKRLSAVMPPDLSQITDPAEELAERTAYKVQDFQRQQAQERLTLEQRAAVQEFEAAMGAAWHEAMSDGRQKMPDFDQVVTEKTPIHALAARHIVESEHTAEIAYYLGKNEGEAKQLFDEFDRDPYRAMKHLGQIEAKISSAPKTITNAPKPASVLSGGKSPVAFDASRASVSDMAAELRKAGVIR